MDTSELDRTRTPSRRPSIRTAWLLLAACVLLLAGCGGSDDGGSSGGDTSGTSTSTSTTSSADAKDSFVSTCGGCHTLGAAGTNGAAGPNLDELAPDEKTVRDQIENGGGAMPAGLLKGADADAVAKYVADNAGK